VGVAAQRRGRAVKSLNRGAILVEGLARVACPLGKDAKVVVGFAADDWVHISCQELVCGSRIVVRAMAEEDVGALTSACKG
jgi:hypothetical protein